MYDDDGHAPHNHGVTPHITIHGGRAAEAITFYEQAFGATELMQVLADDGQRIMHAHLIVNGGSLMLHDEFPEYVGPADTGSGPPAGVVLHLQVSDADAWWERALLAGADVRLPIADQFWGDRYGQLTDPFGYIWSIGSPATKH
ncbi:MAG TPA: VOC family protein [Sphingobium sp.]|uniref:VOC family protein n=1 Tax=Sphingobium sp. TaxID=1912891 RepID=UPI002ED1CACD